LGRPKGTVLQIKCLSEKKPIKKRTGGLSILATRRPDAVLSKKEGENGKEGKKTSERKPRHGTLVVNREKRET